jgi:hypothetical protein
MEESMSDTEQERAAPAAWRSRRMLWLVGTVAVALIAVIVVLSTAGGQEQPGQEFPSQGNAHIADVGAPHPDYNSDPPTSGWHVGRLARWGSYDYVLPDELLIHNLEDGGVILWYPHGTQEQNREHIDRLRQAARGYDRVVIAPRDNLEGEYALTAWTRLDRFPIDRYDEERVREFLEAYEGIDHH